MRPSSLGLFVLTFLESISTTLLQRGVYFYAQEVLHYSQTQNLWLALCSGAAYVLGAFGSHAATRRLGEKQLLIGILAALALLHGGLGFATNPAPLLLPGFVLVGALQGLKWPIIESFVSAGTTPQRLLPLLARYNVTWAVAVAVAVGVSGVLINSGEPALLFYAAAALNVLGVALCWPLPAHPAHLPDAHPERPAAAELTRFSRLLGSARWSMLCSYSLMFVLAPLMPSLFRGLDLTVTEATQAAALMDIVRVLGFALLGAWVGWRGRAPLLGAVIVLLPASFLLIVLGKSLPLVLLGEAVFGACGAFTYTAALYYALVVKNASVDAGGAHEALIGLGFAIGPASGLFGQALTGLSFGHDTSMLLATLPVLLTCAAGASWVMLPLASRSTAQR